MQGNRRSFLDIMACASFIITEYFVFPPVSERPTALALQFCSLPLGSLEGGWKPATTPPPPPPLPTPLAPLCDLGLWFSYFVVIYMLSYLLNVRDSV